MQTIRIFLLVILESSAKPSLGLKIEGDWERICTRFALAAPKIRYMERILPLKLTENIGGLAKL